MEVCGRVAKRYVEDYGIKATTRQKISNYHLIPSANKTNRDKVSKRIEEMMKNKDEPKCERIKSRNADIITISFCANDEIVELSKYNFLIESDNPYLFPILAVLPLQKLSFLSAPEIENDKLRVP